MEIKRIMEETTAKTVSHCSVRVMLPLFIAMLMFSAVILLSQMDTLRGNEWGRPAFMTKKIRSERNLHTKDKTQTHNKTDKKQQQAGLVLSVLKLERAAWHKQEAVYEGMITQLLRQNQLLQTKLNDTVQRLRPCVDQLRQLKRESRKKEEKEIKHEDEKDGEEATKNNNKNHSSSDDKSEEGASEGNSNNNLGNKTGLQTTENRKSNNNKPDNKTEQEASEDNNNKSPGDKTELVTTETINNNNPGDKTETSENSTKVTDDTEQSELSVVQKIKVALGKEIVDKKPLDKAVEHFVKPDLNSTITKSDESMIGDESRTDTNLAEDNIYKEVQDLYTTTNVLTASAIILENTNDTEIQDDNTSKKKPLNKNESGVP
ncbi:uncharacterized protein LOC100177958 [Ciona intestinalis]